MSAIMQPDAMRGKVTLVTGGGSGIGRASSIAFAAVGARVVVSDVAAEGAEQTVATIRKAGGEAIFVRADVSRSAEVAALVRATVERYGRLDYAHNNAGIPGPLGSLLDYSEDTWDALMAVNLKGVWLCMKHEIPVMLAQGGGAIVNTSSIAGLRGSQMLIAYGASKWGVIGMTKSAAQEFAGRGVRVNAVCPGVIDTPMVENGFPLQLTASLTGRQMGRLGAPEEIAQAVVWLCSDAAAFVTGAALPIDGGSTA